MIAMLIVTCSLADPTNCDTKVLADNLGFGQCLMYSQQAAAQYINEHPNQRVTRVMCTDVRRVEYYLNEDQA